MINHDITVEAFRGFDPQDIIKGIMGDSSRIWYARGECACGWHTYFKWANLKHEPSYDFMLNRAKVSHDSEVVA